MQQKYARIVADFDASSADMTSTLKQIVRCIHQLFQKFLLPSTNSVVTVNATCIC